MVYSTIPTEVHYTSVVPAFADDDTLTVSSHGTEATRSHAPKQRNRIAAVSTPHPRLDLFRQHEQTSAIKRTKAPQKKSHANEPTVMQSPSFETFGYPKDLFQKDHNLATATDIEVDNKENMIQKACLLLRRHSFRRISLHSRMEMWQHQLGKPFRALAMGGRLIKSSNSMDCLNRNILDTVLLSPGAVTAAPTVSVHSFAEESVADHANENTQDSAVKGTSNRSTPGKTLNSCDWWNDKNIAVLPIDEGMQEGDTTWLYSKTLWPPVASGSVDPPGNYTHVAGTRETVPDVKEIDSFETDASTLITAKATMYSRDEHLDLFVTEIDLD